ncbi:MAG: hypothetical protein GY811_04085 [Myxococcales bacterium]|nr:hypothetical protein [Myxococcales bacterium]
MGYSTNFEGTIHIENISVVLICDLNPFMGADKRDLVGKVLTEEEAAGLDFYHFDVALSEKMDGMVWNGMEKTYGMADILNFLRVKLGLTFREGDRLLAQGERITDRYFLVVRNGVVVKEPTGEKKPS